MIMNPQLRELHAKRTKVLGEIVALETEIAASGREPTVTDKETLAGFNEFRQEIDDRIARLEAALANERQAQLKGRGREPSGDWPGQRRDNLFGPLRDQGPIKGQGGAAGFVARLVGTEPPPPSGFETVSELMASIKSGLHDPRLSPLAAGQQEGSGSVGGFMIPQEFSAQSLWYLYEKSVVIPRCDFHPMLSQTKTIAGFDTQSASGGELFGGWTPEWIGESETMSVQTAKFRQYVLKAHKLALFAKSSNEIERDQEVLPNMMTTGMGISLAYTLDKAAIHGNGAGEPLGGMNSASKVTVDKESGQAAATIVYQNLATMFSRMHPALLGDAIWMANANTIPWLATLSVDVGTGGSYIPVLTESNGEFRILTKPVVFTDHCKTLGTEGDIVFVNWSAYALGMNKDISVEKSGHVYFASDETAYRSICRADGLAKMSEPFTPENGDTKSWFVTLQTRS